MGLSFAHLYMSLHVAVIMLLHVTIEDAEMIDGGMAHLATRVGFLGRMRVKLCIVASVYPYTHGRQLKTMSITYIRRQVAQIH